MSDPKAKKKRAPYTEQEFEFVRRHWQEMTDKEIGDRIGRGAGGVRNIRRKLGLTNYTRHEWTEEEEQIMRRHYADTPNKEIMKMIPRHSLQAIYRKANGLGLNKSEEFMLEQNRRLGKALAECDAAKANQFNKGHEPMNKGLKQEEYMSPEAIERSKATRFSEGHKPHNTLFDGAITIRHDHPKRGGSPYMHIRISEGEWKQYHRYLWEKHRGPVPEKHVIVFIDGNTMNCSLDNLECITMAENARRNQNREKAAESLRRYWKENPHPARDLSDAYVAGLMAGGDSEIKEYLLTQRPDLIRLARANYQLKRKIKNNGSDKEQ